MSNDTDNRASELDALAAVIEEARGYAQNRLTAKTGVVLDEYSRGAQDGYEQAMRGLDVILSRTPSDVLVERDARIRAEVIDWFQNFDRWITAHDREVAAKTLRDAAVDTTFRGIPGLVSVDAPSEREAVVQDWLYARADRIESQASEKGASDGEQ